MSRKSLVDAWITCQRNWWAHGASDELIGENPTEGLSVIESIAYRADGDLELLGSIAAGPSEDLLAAHGAGIIAGVELLAKQDLHVRLCLAGVWQNAMSDEVFARVQRAAEPGFKFP